MKRILLIVAGIMLFSTVVSAQSPKSKSATPLAKGKSLTSLIERSQGKIHSLQVPDAAKAINGGFTIIDTDRKKKDFKLIAKSLLYTTNSAPMNFADFKKGDQVTVLYVATIKGSNDVITVTKNN